MSADGADTVGLEEHVLGAAQADALGAELPGLGGIAGACRRWCGPGGGGSSSAQPMTRPNSPPIVGVGGGDGAVVDVAGGAVDGEPVALMEGLASQFELLVLLIHLDVAAAGDAAGAHAAGHNGGVGGHAAADGEDALGGLHALDVLGRGLQTDQDHLLAPLAAHSLASSAVKTTLPQAAPGEAARAVADDGAASSGPRHQTGDAAGCPGTWARS